MKNLYSPKKFSLCAYEPKSGASEVLLAIYIGTLYCCLKELYYTELSINVVSFCMLHLLMFSVFTADIGRHRELLLTLALRCFDDFFFVFNIFVVKMP